MRVLALDVGDKRIGVASSDPTALIASPMTTITRRGEPSDVDEVLRLVQEHAADEIIVGLPVSMSGRMGAQAAKVAAFAKILAERAEISVKTFDERLSSAQAERMLKESGVKPSRSRARVDAAAAAVILQSYLDSRRASPTRGARSP